MKVTDAQVEFDALNTLRWQSGTGYEVYRRLGRKYWQRFVYKALVLLKMNGYLTRTEDHWQKGKSKMVYHITPSGATRVDALRAQGLNRWEGVN